MTMTALIFPGQGAQAVGMGKDLAAAHPECKALFDKANEVLGYDLSKLCFEGPIEELTKSSVTQPAVFVVSLACRAALLKNRPDLSFAATAGHSLGEWSALCEAGVVSFEEALKVLEARGRFMQQACEENPGAMMAVMGQEAETLRKIASDCGVEVANFNTPEQIASFINIGQLTDEFSRDCKLETERLAGSARAFLLSGTPSFDGVAGAGRASGGRGRRGADARAYPGRRVVDAAGADGPDRTAAGCRGADELGHDGVVAARDGGAAGRPGRPCG